MRWSCSRSFVGETIWYVQVVRSSRNRKALRSPRSKEGDESGSLWQAMRSLFPATHVADPGTPPIFHANKSRNVLLYDSNNQNTEVATSTRRHMVLLAFGLSGSAKPSAITLFPRRCGWPKKTVQQSKGLRKLFEEPHNKTGAVIKENTAC